MSDYQLIKLNVETNEDGVWTVITHNSETEHPDIAKCENELVARVYAEHLFTTYLKSVQLSSIQKIKKDLIFHHENKNSIIA